MLTATVHLKNSEKVRGLFSLGKCCRTYHSTVSQQYCTVWYNRSIPLKHLYKSPLCTRWCHSLSLIKLRFLAHFVYCAPISRRLPPITWSQPWTMWRGRYMRGLFKCPVFWKAVRVVDVRSVSVLEKEKEPFLAGVPWFCDLAFATRSYTLGRLERLFTIRDLSTR